MSIQKIDFERALLTLIFSGIITSARAETNGIPLNSPTLASLVSVHLSSESNSLLVNPLLHQELSSGCDGQLQNGGNSCLDLSWNLNNKVVDPQFFLLSSDSVFSDLQQTFDAQTFSLNEDDHALNLSFDPRLKSTSTAFHLNAQPRRNINLKNGKKQTILDSLFAKTRAGTQSNPLEREVLETSTLPTDLEIVSQQREKAPEAFPSDILPIPAQIADQSDPNNLPSNLDREEQPSEVSLNELRQQLRIKPRLILAGQVYPPSLSAGIPSAFGANWGDTFISLSGATAGKARLGKVDGSISLGFGLGDSYQLAGLTVAYNIGSIQNFGGNSTFDLQGSRVVHADRNNQVAIAAGWSGFAQYGYEGVIPSTVWGEITSVSLLQPDDPINKLPLLLSVGIGGGYFSDYGGSTNAFGGIGIQVAPQIGLGLAWSGVGLNLGLSFVPVPTLPLTLTATGGDLTNTSEGGSRFILGISYGYNFVPRGY